jgi:hypothetical protein
MKETGAMVNGSLYAVIARYHPPPSGKGKKRNDVSREEKLFSSYIKKE